MPAFEGKTRDTEGGFSKRAAPINDGNGAHAPPSHQETRPACPFNYRVPFPRGAAFAFAGSAV